MIIHWCTFCVVLLAAFPTFASDQHSREMLEALAAQHAKAHGVPVGLVHRVIMRESRYNPRAMNRGNYGLMQIRHETARGMGYNGPANGLLDPNINLTYAVPYLANAYRVAGRNQDRAVTLYSSGYYYEAKRKGLLGALVTGAAAPAPDPEHVRAATPLEDALASLFSPSSSEVSSTQELSTAEEKPKPQRFSQKRNRVPARNAAPTSGGVSTHEKRGSSEFTKPQKQEVRR